MVETCELEASEIKFFEIFSEILLFFNKFSEIVKEFKIFKRCFCFLAVNWPKSVSWPGYFIWILDLDITPEIMPWSKCSYRSAMMSPPVESELDSEMIKSANNQNLKIRLRL